MRRYVSCQLVRSGGQQYNSLANNDFWYRRVRHLSRTPNLKQRTNVDWKQIYYDVEARPKLWVPIRALSPSQLISAYGLGDINTLLVFEEIYGRQQWGKNQPIWSAIRSADVLDHVLNTDQLAYDRNGASMLLLMAEDNLPLIDRVLESMPEGERLEGEVGLFNTSADEGTSKVVEFLLARDYIGNHTELLDQALLSAASRRGDEATIRLLVDRIDNQSVLQDALKRAAISGNGQALLVLMERLHTTREQMNELFDLAHDAKREGSMLALMLQGIRTDLFKSSDFLTEAIKYNYLRIVPLILEHVSPATRDNAVLKEAATSPDLFKILLADRRVRPIPSLGPIIKASRHATKKDNTLFKRITDNPSFSISDTSTHSGVYSSRIAESAHLRAEQVAEILVQDNRIKVEELNKSQLRLLSWSLLGHTNKVVLDSIATI